MRSSGFRIEKDRDRTGGGGEADEVSRWMMKAERTSRKMWKWGETASDRFIMNLKHEDLGLMREGG